MAVRIVKITEAVPNGESGTALEDRIRRMIRRAETRVREERGILLPAGRVLLIVEQEFEDGKTQG